MSNEGNDRRARISAGALRLGAAAAGAFAVGALGCGVVALGKIVVGRAHVGQGSIGKLNIDDLTVHRLTVKESIGDRRSRNRDLIAASFEKWRNGTGSPYDLLSPAVEWTIVGNSLASRAYRGKSEFINQVIDPFNARMSTPLVPVVLGLYADDDVVIALFEACGTARDGKRYSNTYSWYLRMREGQIVEAIAFFDTIAFNDLWTRVAQEPAL